MNDIILKAVSNQKLDHKILAAFKKEGARLGRNLRAKLRYQALLAKQKASLQSLSEGTIPSGLKPWKGPDSDDTLWRTPLAAEIRAMLPMEFPENTSLIEAKRMVHMESLSANMLLDQAYSQLKLDPLATLTSHETFMGVCSGLNEEQHNEMLRIAEGFKPPPGLFLKLSHEAQVAATQIYKSQVESAIKKVDEENKRKAEQKASEKALLDEAASLSATEVLKRAVAEQLKRPNKKNDGGIDHAAMLDIPLKPPSLAQKNGLSPRVAEGQNPKRNNKTFRQSLGQGLDSQVAFVSKFGKGPGKGKNEAKGKGKGKTKGKNKGKGKGKGPGKGKETNKDKGKGKGKAGKAGKTSSSPGSKHGAFNRR